MALAIDMNPMAITFDHHRAVINGLNYHYVICGTGPAVLLCHGFPDSWRVWRHQMLALAEAGFQAIAPDVRGFGETQSATETTAHTSLDVLSDMIGLLDHIGVAQSVIVGHDFGAAAAWAAAALRPDRFPAVVALSVPYGRRPPKSMTKLMAEAGMDDIYVAHFSRPGPADAELEADPQTFFRRFFYTLSGEFTGDVIQSLRCAATGRLTDSLAEPPGPMAWMDETELARHVEQVRRRGARSILGMYRSGERNWELWGIWDDLIPSGPALYIYGDKEASLRFPGRAGAVERMQAMLPKAFPPVKLTGSIGHWCQLEAPEQVNAALLNFLNEIR